MVVFMIMTNKGISFVEFKALLQELDRLNQEEEETVEANSEKKEDPKQHRI